MTKQAPSSRRCISGLTLVELMVTLSVTAIVLALGAPAMGQWVRDMEIRSNAASLLAALQATRAEALTRNASVRLQMVDPQGRPGWSVNCVQVSVRCPAVLRTLPVDSMSSVRWGAALLPGAPALNVVLAGGQGLPGGVSFDALGTAPGIASGVDVARIDITHASDANVRRLVLLISAHGTIFLCDPLAAAASPERCN